MATRMTTEENLLGTFIALLIGIPAVAGVITILTLFNGWALSNLWAWFLIPLGFPGITFTHALGISVVVGFLTYQPTMENSKESKTDWSVLGMLLIRPFLAVGIGYLIHLFM